MPRSCIRWLYVSTFLISACASDPEPTPPTDPKDASTSHDATPPRDVPASNDASTSSDAPTSTSDVSDGAPGARDGRSDVPDATIADGDGGSPPGPIDAASEDGSGSVIADSAIDSDATTPDANGDDADRTDDAADVATDTANDVAAPTPDVATDTAPPTNDAPSDAAGAADTAADGTLSGFPGSALVDSTQGGMINGWIGTPDQLWKLCYSTALHARSGVTFHTNCDYKGVSVSIARVSYMTETRIIGGYNSSSWASPASSTYTNNSGSFLFSVTNAFKHAFPGSSTVPYYTLNNANYGPTFGAGNDWYVHSQLTMGTCRPGYTYQCRVGALDDTTCNVDFCGTPTSSDYYNLEALEVWIH